MRFLSALAFVPVDDVVRTFEHLVDIYHFPVEALLSTLKKIGWVD